MTAEITDLATRAEQVVAGVVNSSTRANGAPLPSPPPTAPT